MSEQKNLLLEILKMQEEMNAKIDPDWRNKQYPWYRAVWTECAELMDHHGWKWWKKQEPNWDQVRLELVDIWHFGMSMFLQNFATAEDALSHLETPFNRPAAISEFTTLIDRLVQSALSYRSFSVSAFKGLLHHAGMSLEDLYKLYVGKNVLNSFRQDYGYKTGGYQKIWNGKEDNEVLMLVLSRLDHNQCGYERRIYKELESAYIPVLRDKV